MRSRGFSDEHVISRPISHEARLPLLMHVDELRTRLIVSAEAIAVAFGFAFWQNHAMLPGAIGFLQNFNAGSFDGLVQARSYYQFVLFTMLATGVLFQIPVAVIGINQMGILRARQLREHRRYAIVAITALALLLPGTDPVTTLLELIPMLVLFELSIVAATVLERRSRRCRRGGASMSSRSAEVDNRSSGRRPALRAARGSVAGGRRRVD